MTPRLFADGGRRKLRRGTFPWRFHGIFRLAEMPKKPLYLCSTVTKADHVPELSA
jgi:hypothetical protein